MLIKRIAEVTRDRVDFDHTKFKKITDSKGYILDWYSGMICPCRKDVTEQPISNCVNCGGSGFYFLDPVEITGIISSAVMQKNYINWSEALQGTAYLSVQPDNKIGWMDKIVVKTALTSFSEVMTVYLDGTTKKVKTHYSVDEITANYKFLGATSPHYDIPINFIQVNPSVLNELIITDDNVLVGDRITVLYKYNPTYLVIELLNDFRNTFVTKGYEDDRLKKLPLRALIKRMHLVSL